MKKLNRIFLSALAVIAPAVAGAFSFNAGCFNVRYHTALDQGDINWDNRKPYVAKTILDNFDIVGLNEMNNLEMQDYIEANIPGFTLTVTGILPGMNPNIFQCHAIIYRTEMFDKLDEGHYWLNVDQTTPGCGWDCSPNIRMTHWVKMRVKETGDEFYFFITHLDHQGNDARNEQALINFNKIREIAGDTPVILTGDHNSAKSRYPFYNLMSSYMDDSRVVSAVPFPWKNDGTLCKWDPENKNTTRIDYIWVRDFKVNTYNHINETYGRGVTPSDHFPIVANVSFDKWEGQYEVFVRNDGRSGGDGSMRSPFQTLDEALKAVKHGGIVNVTAGDVELTTSGAKLSKSVTIRGGWNKAFSEINGKTRIDAHGGELFNVAAPYYLELTNIEVRNASTANNGAAVNCAGARVILNDCVFEDCYAKKNGGAVYCAQQVIANGTRFVRCSAGNYGGGIFTNFQSSQLWWRYELYHCTFEECSAARGSAAYYSGYVRNNINGCTFVRNRASYCGTLALNAGSFDSQTSIVNCTFVGNSVESKAGAINSLKGGSAIFANATTVSPVALANNTILFNSEKCGDDAVAPDDYAGAAVFVLSGELVANNNIIVGNTSNAADGFCDVRAEKSGDANNIFSYKGSTSFTAHNSDLLGEDYADACAKVRSMFACDADGMPEVVQLEGYMDMPSTLLLKSTKFGDYDIRRVDANHLVEELAMVDYDRDVQLKGRIWGDQLGRERSLEDNSTIGAIEYRADDAAGLGSVLTDHNCDIKYHFEGRELVVETESPVEVYDISGRCVKISKSGLRIALANGLYIIRTNTKSLKITINL